MNNQTSLKAMDRSETSSGNQCDPERLPLSQDAAGGVPDQTDQHAEREEMTISDRIVSPNDPFHPESLRLSQDFAGQVGVKKLLTTVPVRKPDRQSFVRVHPDPTYRLDTAVLNVKEDQETYLVEKSLWPELSEELVPTALFTAITRQKVVFLWEIRLPREDGRQDPWSRSALEAASLAIQSWVRVAANMSLGAYDIFTATAPLPEPEWPEIGFQELLKIAFRDRFIQSLDHPVVRRLRGEA